MLMLMLRKLWVRIEFSELYRDKLYKKNLTILVSREGPK